HTRIPLGLVLTVPHVRSVIVARLLSTDRAFNPNASVGEYSEDARGLGGKSLTSLTGGIIGRPYHQDYSDAAYAAQGSLYAKAMMKAMDGNCTNIAVLLQRYSEFCQQLSQDADPRLNGSRVFAQNNKLASAQACRKRQHAIERVRTA